MIPLKWAAQEEGCCPILWWVLWTPTPAVSVCTCPWTEPWITPEGVATSVKVCVWVIIALDEQVVPKYQQFQSVSDQDVELCEVWLHQYKTEINIYLAN